MKYLVNDTETVGLNPPKNGGSGVVEVAYAEIDPVTLKITDEFVSRVNPGCSIDPGASKVHGIYDADVFDCPALSEVFAMPEATISIGHNTQFDIKFLAPCYENLAGSLCTLALARQYIKGSENHKLGTLAAHLGLPPAKAHSALGDVHTTVHLLRWLVDKSGRSLEALVAAARKPKNILTMPFGKHKGVSLLSLPTGYAQWFLQQEIDQDLRYSLEQSIKVRV